MENITKEEFLTSFFSLLNNCEAEYFVYGEYRNLPKDTGGSDIDMIVSKKDFHKTITTLNTLAKNNNIVLASTYPNANANGLFYRYIYKQGICEWGVQIDIFEDGLFYKGVQYFPINRLQKHIIEHNGIKVVNLNYGFFAGYFKEILHKGKAKEKYRAAVIEAMQHHNTEYTAVIKELYGNESIEIIKENLTLEGLNSIGKQLKKKISKKILKSHFLLILKTRLLLLTRTYQKKPGYVIAVLGTDGSGKSTIINAITPWLNEGFHNGVIYNHLRPNVFPDLGVVLGKKKTHSKEAESNVCSTPHEQTSSGFVGSIIRWAYYMLDYTIGYMKSVWKTIHINSKVFIFDRYYYDYYIDQKRSRTSLPYWIIRFGEYFVPEPDLIICLGGNPEKIYMRKPETSLEEVTRQNKVLKLFCENRKKAVWIDTTTTINESIDTAKTAIYKMLAKKFN